MSIYYGSSYTISKDFAKISDEILGSNGTVLVLMLCVAEGWVNIELYKTTELLFAEALSRADNCK